MEGLEIILTALGSTSATSIVNYFIFRKKYKAENTGASDQVLYNRIEFLEQRLNKLEQYQCFKKTCTDRIS